MPKRKRSIVGGMIYHVLNRGNGRAALFEKPADYEAFGRVLVEAYRWEPLRILAWCLMPNHWHMVVWPARGVDGQVSEFLRWLTVTHTRRWHAHHGTSGTGHLYQGRFKSFPVQRSARLLGVLRYVERNPLRANLVACAEDWRWSSLWHREHLKAAWPLPLADWPVARPRDWIALVNRPDDEEELAALRTSLVRNRPYGEPDWQRQTAARLGLASTLRPPGRPRKEPRQ
jgi:putative transposase